MIFGGRGFVYWIVGRICSSFFACGILVLMFGLDLLLCFAGGVVG